MKTVYIILLLIYQIVLHLIDRKFDDDKSRLIIGLIPIAICIIGALG